MKASNYKKGIIIRAKSHAHVIINKQRLLVEGSYQEIIWKKAK